MNDCFGNEIQRGDVLAFASKSGSSPATLRIGVVLEVGEDKDFPWIRIVSGAMNYLTSFDVYLHPVKLTNPYGMMLLRGIDIEKIKQYMLSVTGKRREARGLTPVAVRIE